MIDVCGVKVIGFVVFGVLDAEVVDIVEVTNYTPVEGEKCFNGFKIMRHWIKRIKARFNTRNLD